MCLQRSKLIPEWCLRQSFPVTREVSAAVVAGHQKVCSQQLDWSPKSVSGGNDWSPKAYGSQDRSPEKCSQRSKLMPQRCLQQLSPITREASAAVIAGHQKMCSQQLDWSPKSVSGGNDWSPMASGSQDRSPEVCSQRSKLKPKRCKQQLSPVTREVLAVVVAGHQKMCSQQLDWSPRVSTSGMTGHPRPVVAKTGHRKCVRSGLS